jgi:hypothetical protein
MFRYAIVAIAALLAWKTWGAEFVAANQDNAIGQTFNVVRDGAINVADEVTSWGSDDWKLIGVTASVMVLLSTFFKFKRWMRSRGMAVAGLPGIRALFPNATQAFAASEQGAMRNAHKLRGSVAKRIRKGQARGWTQMNLRLGRATQLAAESISNELRDLGYTTEIRNRNNGHKTLRVSWRPQERQAPLV